MLASPVWSSCAECLGWLLSHTQKDEVPHNASERVGESLLSSKMCLAMHWKEEEEQRTGAKGKAGERDDRLVHACT